MNGHWYQSPSGKRIMKTLEPEAAGERIAKVIARSGLCSRREAERWIEDRRVKVNGKTIETPALAVSDADVIVVDGSALPEKPYARVWRYHKPRGLVTTHADPQKRPTVFQRIPKELGRVISVGRLDLGSEGLLLLTNDGELAGHMERPASGWTRRYRVRAFGTIEQERLDSLRKGIRIDGVAYGPIDAALDKSQGSNIWLTMALKEGKNREIRKVLEHLGLTVNRLIRTSYGPFQLGSLARGEVSEVPRKALREQLGNSVHKFRK
jgi:23S rRNA pseudouridine2605 synthase